MYKTNPLIYPKQIIFSDPNVLLVPKSTYSLSFNTAI
jgi:hypothetical protein